MTGLLYYLVEKMAIIHDAIMTWRKNLRFVQDWD